MIVGYTVLNIFVESGSITQPIKDDVASTVSNILINSSTCQAIYLVLYTFAVDVYNINIVLTIAQSQ